MHYDPTKCSGDGCTAIAEEFQRIAKNWNDDDTYTGFIISPYPDMDTVIALTAWRHHLRLDEVDEPRILEFHRRLLRSRFRAAGCWHDTGSMIDADTPQ